MKDAKTKWTWTSAVAALHVIAVLVGLPIVYKNYYYDILEIKYYYYCGCAILLLAGILGYILLTVRPKVELEKLKGKKVLEIFTVTDLAMIALGIVITLSTILSPFKWEAFWGNEGRYSGLFLMGLYILVYFCLTRCFRMRDWYVDLCLAAGMAVCLFGLTHWFKMDLLGFKENIKDNQRYMFVSFIGNINTYTALVAVYMGIAATMWVGTKDKWKSAWYYVALWITYLAIVTGQSDNAYLAIMALFGFLPLYAFRTRRGVRRYVVLLATFLSSLKVIEWILTTYPDKVVALNSIYNKIVGFEKLKLVIGALWAAAAVLYLIDYISKKQDAEMPKWLRRGWLGVIAAVVIGVFYVCYDVNIAKNGEKYGAAQSYLEFNDRWGTNRGYVWRIAMEDYMNFSLLQKIFGYGPDTFGLMTYFHNLKEMTEQYAVLFDSAHNEYLQYFITIGPIGLLAYLVILAGAFAEVIKKGLQNPCIVAVMIGVLCYLAQAVVNINQPIATPIMWTLLCMGVAGCRKAQESKEGKSI